MLTMAGYGVAGCIVQIPALCPGSDVGIAKTMSVAPVPESSSSRAARNVHSGRPRAFVPPVSHIASPGVRSDASPVELTIVDGTALPASSRRSRSRHR